MSEQNNRKILIGILICLIIIALKPTSYIDSNYPDSFDVYNQNEAETVIQLADNRIAIVDTNEYSSNQGKIIVLEFDESNETFDVIGRYDYLEDLYEDSW